MEAIKVKVHDSYYGFLFHFLDSRSNDDFSLNVSFINFLFVILSKYEIKTPFACYSE